MKVTVPVGVPLLEFTVAVKVTDCPKVDGFGTEATTVVVATVTVFTVCVIVPVLFAKPPVPVKFAEMV